jgi:Lrp/AsnC family transcriptional regulator, regulator for asnA, asnC and gidA
MQGNRSEAAGTDGLDGRLLEALRKNSRESFVELASRLGTSEGTVRTRLRRLTGSGAIRAFTIRTAAKNVKAMIDVKVDTNVDTSDISRRISRIGGVEGVWEVSGDWDIVVIVETMSTSELNEVIERIRKVPRTISTQTRLILKETWDER